MSSIDALAVLEVDQVADRLEDVALGEDGVVERLVELELVVQLEAADLREVVALGVEEQVVEQVLRRLERRRIARAQAAVDLHDRLVGGLQLVGDERVAQVRADVQVVDEEDLELVDAVLAQLVELRLGELLVALEEHLAGRLVDDVAARRPCRPAPRPRPAGARRSSPCSFLMASLVNLRFFLTRISRESGWRMSRLARWPGSRSYSTDLAYFLLGSR